MEWMEKRTLDMIVDDALRALHIVVVLLSCAHNHHDLLLRLVAARHPHCHCVLPLSLSCRHAPVLHRRSKIALLWHRRSLLG